MCQVEKSTGSNATVIPRIESFCEPLSGPEELGLPAKIPNKRHSLALKHEAEPGRASELSRHLVEAQEEERKRISRELHDEAGQGLMALRLHLGRLMAETSDRESAAQIEEAMTMLDGTISDLRRIIARLSPRTLNELGLLAAMRKEVRLLSKRAGIAGSLAIPAGLPELPHESEIVIYRTVQEALHNIAKHSRATRFSVRLEWGGSDLILRIEDDGVGFVTKPNSQTSFGLMGMRERIAAFGGTVRIRSRQGRGTRIRVKLPSLLAGQSSSGQHQAGLTHQGYASTVSARPAKAAEFRELLKPSLTFRHADQVHSN